jgi:hypothetical protein
MRVVLSVPGVFHHFALARELMKRQHLTRVNTTFPWMRIEREGIPRNLVRTFPFVHPIANCNLRRHSEDGSIPRPPALSTALPLQHCLHVIS